MIGKIVCNLKLVIFESSNGFVSNFLQSLLQKEEEKSGNLQTSLCWHP